MFMRIKTKQKQRRFGPTGNRGHFFPEVVLLCTCVVLHLHIEGVLSKGHLLKKGEVVKKEIWWAEVKSQEDDRRQQHFWTLVLAAKSSTGHQMTSSPWPEVSQDSFTDWDHLLINCSTSCFFFLLLVHTPVIFFFFLSFFLGFLTLFGENCGFQMAGQT